MSLRIFSGRFKGRKLKSSPEKNFRPISGMIKEALFSILANRISGSVFVDLFAGTGSAGLEALSRGAERVVFVEKDFSRVKLIRENISMLGEEDSCLIVHGDVFDYICGEEADIIFAGPPYGENLSEDILVHCLQSGMLTEGNLLVIQHHKKEVIGDIKGISLRDWRKYGKSRLDFFVRESCIQ